MGKGARYLALVSGNVDEESLKNSGRMNSVIVRKRSYAVEVDYHTTDPKGSLELLGESSKLVECRELSEEGKVYDIRYFQSLLARKNEVLAEARKMFREERYWEAHTVLEDLWKAASGKEKKTLQGAIIIAASMTHYQMDELDTAVKMYSKGTALIKEGTGLLPKDYGFQGEFKYPVIFPEVFQ